MLYQWYLRRQHRNLWRNVCAALEVPFAQPVATGTIDGFPIEIRIDEKHVPVAITTGVTELSFTTPKEDPDAPKTGDMWFDAKVSLRGGALAWRRVLDRPTREAVEALAFYSRASLTGGTLRFTGTSLKASVMSPTVAERVDPIRSAVAIAKRLVECAASSDDAGAFETAFGKRGSQRERLTTIKLLQASRSGDPQLAEGLARLAASADAGDRMLVLLARGDHAAIVKLASELTTPSRVMIETVDTLRALNPDRAVAAIAIYDRTIGQRTTPISPDKYEATTGLAMSIAIAHTAFYDELDRDLAARRTIVETIAAFA